MKEIVKPEIECPHCKQTFPIPKKRHIFSQHRGGWSYRSPGTLCGKDDTQLIAKEGETVNCKPCLNRKAAGKI